MMNDEQFSRIMDALGHKYRRRLLIALRDHNPQDAADPQGAARALGSVRKGEVDDDRVETELGHVHLPKLEDEEYITWDRDAGTIEKGPNWEEIEPLLDLLVDHDDELPDDWI